MAIRILKQKAEAPPGAQGHSPTQPALTWPGHRGQQLCSLGPGCPGAAAPTSGGSPKEKIQVLAFKPAFGQVELT